MAEIDIIDPPKELRERRQWVLWGWQNTKKEKLTKVPLSADGHATSITKAKNYLDYDEAVNLAELYGCLSHEEAYALKEEDNISDKASLDTLGGIGFCFTEDDPFVGIDIDGQEIDSKLMHDIVSLFDSYTEISPSGAGAHIFIKGQLPNDGKGFCDKTTGLEIYEKNRYFTFSGKAIHSPDTIRADQAAVDEFLDKYMIDEDAVQEQVQRVLMYGADALKTSEWNGEYQTIEGVPLAQDIVVGIKNLEGVIDRSAFAYYAASALYVANLSDNDIIGIFMNPDYAISQLPADKHHPAKWIAKYILPDARSKAKKDKVTLLDRGLTLPLPPSKRIRELVNILLRSSIYPRPNLALSSVLSAVSNLAAGIYQFSGVRSNLYLCSHSPTGGGKNHYLFAAEAIIQATGLQGRVGASEYASGVALEKGLARNPDLFASIDEFGKILGHSKKDTWASTTRTALLKLFSSANGEYRGSAALSRNEGQHSVIEYPCLSVLGTTTLETLTESLSSSDLFDGFLNRFIIIDSGDLPDPVRRPTNLHEELRNNAGWLTLFEMHVHSQPAHRREKPIKVKMSEEVDERFYQMLVHQTNIRAGRVECRYPELWGRFAENAKKLAMLVAVVEDMENPVVTDEITTWAETFLTRTIEQFTEIASNQFFESEADKEYHMVLSKLRELHDDHKIETTREVDKFFAKKGFVTERRLLRKTHLSKKHLLNIVDTLEARGVITIEKHVNPYHSSKEVVLYKAV